MASDDRPRKKRPDNSLGVTTYDGTNMEFERHSRSGRESGKPDINPEMRDALKKIYKENLAPVTTGIEFGSVPGRGFRIDPDELG